MAGTFVQNTTTNPNQTYFVFVGQTKRVSVEFKNSNDVYYDPAVVTLTIYKPDFTVLIAETYSVSSPNVKKASIGNYYIDLTSNGSDYGDYQFVWTWQDTAGGVVYSGFQMVSSVPIQVIMASNYLRNQIDKVQKEVLSAPIGYNDEQLFMAIRGGLDNINRFPTQTSYTLVTYPWSTDRQLLIDAATIVALQSQSIFSIDTDINSYSMQGNSMSVDHFSKLQTFIGQLQSQLDKNMRFFKLSMITRNRGQVLIQRNSSYRSQLAFQHSSSGISWGALGVR